MESQRMMRWCVLTASALMLASCGGYEKGTDRGVGFDALDTESKASKDNEEWFRSYYGGCHSVWGGGCKGDGTASGGGGGGGFWGGSMGPSDAVSDTSN